MFLQGYIYTFLPETSDPYFYEVDRVMTLLHLISAVFWIEVMQLPKKSMVLQRQRVTKIVHQYHYLENKKKVTWKK